MKQNRRQLYLVTGAAGFIGAALAKRLRHDGHRVVSIDNLSTGYRRNVPVGVEFYKADCQDARVYRMIPQERYDAIFHTAGQSSGEISFEDPVYDLRANTESTLHLLRFALTNGCRRFIYASSMSVYGQQPDVPVKESAVTFPESFYGVGKLASEQYLRLYEKYGMHSTSLRLFNVYGPGQNLENLRQGMVSIYLAQMIQSGHIVIKGSRDRYRDFVYIDDVVNAFVACLSRRQSWGRVLNIGTGKRTTVKGLLETLMEVYGRQVSLEFIGGTEGDIGGMYADTRLMKKILGIRIQYSLRQGLNKMVAWALCR